MDDDIATWSKSLPWLLGLAIVALALYFTTGLDFLFDVIVQIGAVLILLPIAYGARRMASGWSRKD